MNPTHETEKKTNGAKHMPLHSDDPSRAFSARA